MLRELRVIAILVLLLTSATTAFCEESVERVNERLLQDAKYLASDELEGRGVGSEGLVQASNYIRDQFLQAGLNVKTLEDQPFQKFDLITSSKLGMPNTLELQGPNGEKFLCQMNTDYEVCVLGGSGTVEANIVFCGYGIDAPDLKYSDYEGIDVAGKVVLIMRRNPQQGVEKGPFGGGHGISRHAELRTKIQTAASRNAAAVIFVNDPFAGRKAAKDRQASLEKANETVLDAAEALIQVDAAQTEQFTAAKNRLSEAVNRRKGLLEAVAHPKDDTLMPFGYAGPGDAKITTPAVHITQALCDQMLGSTLKKSLTELEAEIDSDFKPRSAELIGWKAHASVSIDRVRSVVANVIGTVDGQGPLAQETIVIGAHYDHVGRGGTGSLAPGSTDVHNGADDNASGTVALLELARRFGQSSQRPSRRLVFIAFTGEELGLLGSAKYVKDPVYPLDQTIAMFNMDMVGRLQENKLVVFGTGTSSRWVPELNELNAQARFEYAFKPEGFGPSDHSSFYGKKIPVLHFFTGNHPDYHRPSDDWDKLNIEGIRRVVDLVESLVLKTDAATDRPDYLEVKGAAQMERAGNRPYVGTIPDFSSEEPGYSISGVASGGPAQKGGLQGGDRIIKLGENNVTGLDDFDAALRKFQPGEAVEFVVIRAGKEITLLVVLDPPR